MRKMKATVSLFRTNAKKMRLFFFNNNVCQQKLKAAQRERCPVILTEVEHPLCRHNRSENNANGSICN